MPRCDSGIAEANDGGGGTAAADGPRPALKNGLRAAGAATAASSVGAGGGPKFWAGLLLQSANRSVAVGPTVF